MEKEEQKIETISKGDVINNILFVDGDESLMNDIKDWVANSEIETKYKLSFNYAKDVKEALKKIDEMEINLIILEIALPIISGYYLIKALRNENKNIPVIIYTRLKNSQDLAKMADSKVNNIFIKDLMSFQDLVEIIRKKETAADIDVIAMELSSQIKALRDTGEQAEIKLMQCPRCGLIIAPDSHFCNNCGQKIFKKTKKVLKKTPEKSTEESAEKSTEESAEKSTEENAEKTPEKNK